MALRTDRLIIPQGTSWEVRWPVLDTDGSPADLTKWSPRAQARSSISSDEIIHTWSVDDGSILILDDTVSMKVEPETSSTWEWRTAVFDVELVHEDGRVVRISQGQLTLDPEVTR